MPEFVLANAWFERLFLAGDFASIRAVLKAFTIDSSY